MLAAYQLSTRGLYSEVILYQEQWNRVPKVES